MDADDRWAPREWTTTSPKDLDRLAHGVLKAAREAARELRRRQLNPTRRTWVLGVLAGQTQAMLGPSLPVPLPTGTEAQEEFVRTALALAVHVRAHSWAEQDFGPPSTSGQTDVPHPGEVVTAEAFEVLGRLMLPHSSAEGWTATLITDVARGDQKLEAAVKLGKYLLHPTFLAVANDATGLVGEALHEINKIRLQELVNALAQPPGPTALQPTTGYGSPSATPATYAGADLPAEWQTSLPISRKTKRLLTQPSTPKPSRRRPRHQPPHRIQEPDSQPDTQPPWPPQPLNFRPPEPPEPPEPPQSPSAF